MSRADEETKEMMKDMEATLRRSGWREFQTKIWIHKLFPDIVIVTRYEIAESYYNGVFYASSYEIDELIPIK